MVIVKIGETLLVSWSSSSQIWTSSQREQSQPVSLGPAQIHLGPGERPPGIGCVQIRRVSPDIRPRLGSPVSPSH